VKWCMSSQTSLHSVLQHWPSTSAAALVLYFDALSCKKKKKKK
jgi:hypothetical protein